MTDQKKSRFTAVFLGIVIVILTALVVSAAGLIHWTQPWRQAKKEAVTIAQEYADLTEVERFYAFNWQKTYYTVLGTDSNGRAIAVVIPETGGEELRVISQEDGYNEKAIRTIMKQDYGDPAIKKINLGVVDQEVVWEVVTQGADKALTYYLLSFETGAEVKVVSNI